VPELPEVESVRRQLDPLVVGRTLTGAWRDPTPSRRMGDVSRAVGLRVEALERRGKFLLAALAPGGLELVVHLGMSGSLEVLGSDDVSPTTLRPVRDDPRRAHDRARFALDGTQVLVFRDPRRFGRVGVIARGAYEDVPTLARLGPEPLTAAFDAEDFARALARTTAPVKARLLDQRLVAGVGNIYADESLWRARIHPASRRVGRTRALALHAAIREVLAAAIEREGTTFRDHRLVNGQSGRYLTELEAYGQAGLPCSRCGTAMRHGLVAGRGTTWCPDCQRA